jgi:hypothetical protein
MKMQTPMAVPISMPTIVRIRMPTFGSTCRVITLVSPTPFARAVWMKSACSVSATVARIMRVYSARKRSANVIQGRIRCDAQSTGPLHGEVGLAIKGQ